MRKYINLILLITSIGLFSCEKFLEPKNDNTLSEDKILNDMSYAEGILMRGYINISDQYNFETDIASDDAVTNDIASSYRRMATGEWASTFDPISVWTIAYEQIFYINKFLSIYQSVIWANDPRLPKAANDLKNAYYKKRLKGEAFALRAWYKYRLLQYHGGMSSGGTLLGFPIINENLSTTGNWQLPRNTYAECVTSIFADLDSAVANLPSVWADSITNLPTNNPGDPALNATNLALNIRRGYYNVCAGARYENRMNGNTARALKARVALLAASPTFSAASGVTWAQAATIAGSLLSDLGALYTSSATIYNHTFYKQTKNKEIIWNRAQTSRRDWEQNNFPPSLNGNGRVNPSQNLVDAFPMLNGYPVSHASSGYNPDNPYVNRDKRFYEYIVYNTASLKSTKINTYVGATQNGIGILTTSTRTGYYLKKLLLETVSLSTSSPTSVAHTTVLLRMTELLLNYAEAANEAWGPDGDPTGLGFTARTKIAECRLQAGINPDPYLASLSTTAEFRDLIRNERRVSLCFENFRFWDVRRWNDLTAMKAAVIAAVITQVDGVDTTWNYQSIEDRAYSDDMIYGPIPYNETLKYGIEQNKGW